MTRTLKILTASLAAIVMAIAVGGGTARAGGVHFDFAISAPIPFGYATIYSDHYYPHYYGPYYYYPRYYAPSFRPGYVHVYKEVYRPSYKRVYRYERHVIRDGRHWRGHDRDRWRDRDGRHDRRWRR